LKAQPLSLKGQALRLLAQREHSRVELERKLRRKLMQSEAPPEEDDATAQIRGALDDLTARGLLSDDRAAESVLASQGRRYGSRRLKQSLLAKGLAPALVASTVRQARATDDARAAEIWHRRFGPDAPGDAAARARQMRFLAGRGFDGETIQRVLKGAEEPNGAKPAADPDALNDALD
jgi:regulatory protein